MKVVILAGGYGSRLAEETNSIPKPMVEIGGKPILWHIMKTYSAYGFNEFIICLGYKGYVIKEYFKNYLPHHSDFSINLADGKINYLKEESEDWKVTLVDTGSDVMTGGRLKRVSHLIDDDIFCFTYGDGVGDINIPELVKFHEKHQKLATMTVACPPGRFGVVQLDGDSVLSFEEKPKQQDAWVNAGFFILSRSTLEHIDGDDTSWEQAPLEKLANINELAAFRHNSFWQPMDTLRDRNHLETLWKSNNAKWKVWE